MAKLHFYYSAMNAGKSTMLIQSSYNYHERGMQTRIYTPIIDDRSQVDQVYSRIGIKMTAVPFDASFNLYEDTKDALRKEPKLRCILVDEAQFLNKQQVSELCRICDELNLPVLCYGLRSDFKGHAFEGSQHLLAWADLLIEIKTICFCGKKATMNIRVDENRRVLRDGAQVEIGGNERYLSVCRKHFHSLEFIPACHHDDAMAL